MLTSIAVLAAIIVSISANQQGCGGLLEGDNGEFDYIPTAVAGNQAEHCVWLVRSYAATEIQITLNDFLPADGLNSSVLLYPDGAPGAMASNPITLNSQSIGSTTALQGSLVVIILPQSQSSLFFSWDTELADNVGRNDSVTVAGYIEIPQGRLTWTPARKQEKLWWVFGAGRSAEDADVEWETQVDLTDCDEDDPCTCLSFEAFELNSKGNLLEAARVCGRSSGGFFQMRSSGPLVVAASANTTARGNSKVQLRWVEDQSSASTTTSTTPPDGEPSIYFATAYHGVSKFSREANQVTKIINSSENINGVTHDSISNKLYWCGNYGTIYRSNVDGTQPETVFASSSYGAMFGMAVDPITGNIYVTTYDGFILICRDGPALIFKCFIVVDGQSEAYGITLDTTRGPGFMYWTRYSNGGSIYEAQMDGYSPHILVTGLTYPLGLTIDFASQRLFWVEDTALRIQSSDFSGHGIQLVFQLPTGSHPWGIAVLNDRIYWGNRVNYKLQSVTRDGHDLQTLHTEANEIHHLTVVPASDQPTSRSNDCAGHNCTTICVLTLTSYRCLAE